MSPFISSLPALEDEGQSLAQPACSRLKFKIQQKLVGSNGHLNGRRCVKQRGVIASRYTKALIEQCVPLTSLLCIAHCPHRMNI
ncbi:hypothetical protein SRHO_G00005350 [Serrasalmus rhombeus]